MGTFLLRCKIVLVKAIRHVRIDHFLHANIRKYTLSGNPIVCTVDTLGVLPLPVDQQEEVRRPAVDQS